MARPPLPDSLKGYHARRYLFDKCCWEDESVKDDKPQTVDAEKVREIAESIVCFNEDFAPCSNYLPENPSSWCNQCRTRHRLLALVEGV